MADILSAMQTEGGNSPEHKRARSDARLGDSKAASSYSSLSLGEVSRVLLQHDQDLRQLHAATTLALKFPVENETARSLLGAVRHWQKPHVRGKPHPYGSCSTAVATVLFDLICTFATNTPNVQNETAINQLRSMLALKQPGLIAQEASHCSARTSAKETHIIVELRMHSAAGLLTFSPWFKVCLCAMGGELLGPKPAPGWSRKLRGQQ